MKFQALKNVAEGSNSMSISGFINGVMLITIFFEKQDV